MTKKIPFDVAEEFGGETALLERIAAFAAAREAHKYTVDVPAPVEVPLIELLVAEGGVEAVEVEAPPPAPEPAPEPTYRELRKAAYIAAIGGGDPLEATGNMFDALYWKDQGDASYWDGYVATITAIKAQYPKQPPQAG